MSIERRRCRPVIARMSEWGMLLALALGLALSLLGPGCGNEGPAPISRKKVAIKDLPEPILGAAKKALPGIDFEEAWENLDADRKPQSYEIKGRAANGKIREARVSLTGQILETE